ncbi:MAG: squalene--hopene cyclase [Rhodobacterales bacterium]|nr:squalene--hopene cyclase [Rhodobacterales bacterium]
MTPETTASRFDDPADPAAGFDARLDGLIDEAGSWLSGQRRDDGHWVFELEADATIPAEYILLNHYLDEIDDETEQAIAVYLRRIQGDHGGWPLFHDGDVDISATVKAYYALKLVGDDPEAPHMRKAREAILARGGAAKANVFTRIALALFGQVPWRAVPVMRIEAMLLPRWAPFHFNKVSYWSRTVMVPLLILATLKPVARNPRRVDVRELFLTPPERHGAYLNNPTGHWLGSVLLGVDKAARLAEPLFPRALRDKAIAKALAFIKERLNGVDGLGGIFPAMTNTLMAYDVLGYPKDHPDYVITRQAIDRLLVRRDGMAYCQPCLSPVWDTCLASHAMQEAGHDPDGPVVSGANDWLKDRQILDTRGDWIANRGHLQSGGWAFQYWNNHYPDVDDTAVVVMALHRADPQAYAQNITRAADWIIGMQSANGGWGAFDADNEYYFLEHIPFADHGALLDPPSVDVSARCIGMLAQLGYDRDHPTVARGLAYLRGEQEDDGSWFGRWGTNYVYGTWSALTALNAAGEDMSAPPVRKAVDWLLDRQRPDGGWGEDCSTYWHNRKGEVKASTPSQTAWALLGLMAAGEVDHPAVKRGIDYLMQAPRDGGKWDETFFNAVGFPRVFYLRYHGYSAYFPLWALARYRNLSRGNVKQPLYGL